MIPVKHHPWHHPNSDRGRGYCGRGAWGYWLLRLRINKGFIAAVTAQGAMKLARGLVGARVLEAATSLRAEVVGGEAGWDVLLGELGVLELRLCPAPARRGLPGGRSFRGSQSTSPKPFGAGTS